MWKVVIESVENFVNVDLLMGDISFYIMLVVNVNVCFFRFLLIFILKMLFLLKIDVKVINLLFEFFIFV